MIDLERLKARREMAKGLVTSYCSENGIEQNAWVFALSFLELELKAKFNYVSLKQ